MTISSVRPDTTRPIVPEAKCKWLGTARGWDFVERDGIEYSVDQWPTSDPAAFAARPGEILIARKVTERLDGRDYETHAYHRAVPAETGTFAALHAKEAADQARRTRKAAPRPIDALASHPLLARRPGGLLQIAEVPGDPTRAVLSKSPSAIRLPERARRRGVAAILAVLESKGVELKLTEAGTVCAIGDRVTKDVNNLIEVAGPLLHAHLQGSPLRCELTHSENQAPEAVSLAAGGAAICEQHAAGEIEP